MTGNKSHDARPPRIGVRQKGYLTLSDGSQVDVTLTNISESGFSIKSEEVLEAGERVKLTADRHGEMSAEIRWVDGFTAGGVILSPAPRLD